MTDDQVSPDARGDRRIREDEDAPLPLSDLRERVPLSTYQWLLEKEPKDEEEKVQPGFFESDEEEETWTRVRQWCSSTTAVDGIGGYKDSEDPPETDQKSGVGVHYILSAAGGGHGDDLWAASRHVANCLANSEACVGLLSALSKGQTQDAKKLHPLLGLKFLELGAGAGVPSWTAMWCGAKVVCTDQAIPDRIRCMAESAQRNWATMKDAHHVDTTTLANAKQAQVCPYDWGTPTGAIANLLSDEAEHSSFDVIVAADCIYMPEFHEVLLKSIDMLLSDNGVALLPFALHGNTSDDNVWAIFELAKNNGFQVEKLGSSQLTPQAYGMDRKRAFVHMLRLTKSRV